MEWMDNNAEKRGRSEEEKGGEGGSKEAKAMDACMLFVGEISGSLCASHS